MIWWWKRLQKQSPHHLIFPKRLSKHIMGQWNDTWRNFKRKPKRRKSTSMRQKGSDSFSTTKIWLKTINDDPLCENVESLTKDYCMKRRFKKSERRRRNRKMEFVIPLAMNQLKMKCERMNWWWRSFKEKL